MTLALGGLGILLLQRLADELLEVCDAQAGGGGDGNRVAEGREMTGDHVLGDKVTEV